MAINKYVHNYNTPFRIDGNASVSGTITCVDINSTSDINLKTNIHPILSALSKINQLSGVEFTWKETNKPSIGVIAQEIEKVLPQLVVQEEVKTVNYNGLIGVLIEAVKELNTKLEEQEKIIQELKNK